MSDETKQVQQEKARPFHYKSCPYRTDTTKPCGCGRIRSGVAEKLFGEQEANHCRDYGQRCKCGVYHYSCADCGVDVTQGTTYGPGYTDPEDVTRCHGCHEAEGMRRYRIEKAGPDLLAAIKGLLDEPYGCTLCDSGAPRNPAKGHQPGCPYEVARVIVAKAEGR